jgi:CheY-like chemotaxis protein
MPTCSISVLRTTKAWKMDDRLLVLSAQIVAAYTGNNILPQPRQLAELIRAVHEALSSVRHNAPANFQCTFELPELHRTELPRYSNDYGDIKTELANIKALLQTINGELDRNRSKTGDLSLQPVFDVEAVAIECLNLVRAAAEIKELALSIAVAPGTRRRLAGDPMQLRQVLLILLGNAVKFTARGGVELRLRPIGNGTRLLIEITDTGPGMSIEQQQHVFKKVDPLSDTTRNGIPSVNPGLGLSVRLARMMGGRLGHQSNPGGGSIFYLDLPLDTFSAPPSLVAFAPDFSDTDQAEVPRLTTHVLVVDNDPIQSNVAMAILVKSGFRVTCAGSGIQAIAAAESTDFDVIVMDVRMPGMDGVEATRRIRSMVGARGSVPIFAATAQDAPEQINRCLNAGMNGYLHKPFTPDALIAMVSQTVMIRQEHGNKSTDKIGGAQAAIADCGS